MIILALGMTVCISLWSAWKNRGNKEGRIYAVLGVLFLINFAGEVLEWLIK